MSHEKVRSTTHRSGWIWKPRRSGSLRTISRSRPRIRALGLPAADNPVTAALQAAATGHGSEHDVLATVLAHTWIVPGRPDGCPVLSIHTGHTPTPGRLARPEHPRHPRTPRRCAHRDRPVARPGSSLSVTVPAADLH
nr:hypothetical protein [Streptomyces sp. TLI_235]